jgi:hypothetical protein
MPAHYDVIDQLGAYISPSSPYSRPFLTFNRLSSGTAYLILTVKTGYSDPVKNALVFVNSITIGNIEPRQWTNHLVIAEETIILPFANTLLQNLPALGGLGINFLSIMPTGTDPDNYVLLGTAICHFYQG